MSRLSQSTWVLERRYSSRFTERGMSEIDPMLMQYLWLKGRHNV